MKKRGLTGRATGTARPNVYRATPALAIHLQVNESLCRVRLQCELQRGGCRCEGRTARHPTLATRRGSSFPFCLIDSQISPPNVVWLLGPAWSMLPTFPVSLACERGSPRGRMLVVMDPLLSSRRGWGRVGCGHGCMHACMHAASPSRKLASRNVRGSC